MRDRSIALVIRNDKILSVQTNRFGGCVNELPWSMFPMSKKKSSGGIPKFLKEKSSQFKTCAG